MNVACFGTPDAILLPGWDAEVIPLYEADIEKLHECAYTHVLVHPSFSRIDALKASADFFSLPLSGFTENLTPHTGQLFKSLGIARLLSTEQLIRYGRRVLEAPGERENCRILLCESDEVFISMIRTICEHFGCELECVPDQNEALAALDAGHDLFLLNIDQKSFECTRFIHRASSMRSMMKSLFVPYMSTGLIHVSDILSGLGRFSRVILSGDELYSFLVTLFHNKGLQRTAAQLIAKMEPLCTENADMSVRQLYSEKGTDIFTLDCACNEKVESTWERLEALRSVVARVVPFKWLVMRHHEADFCREKQDAPDSVFGKGFPFM